MSSGASHILGMPESVIILIDDVIQLPCLYTARAAVLFEAGDTLFLPIIPFTVGNKQNPNA